MQVTIHAAKTNLSKLIDAALSGEEVVIAKGRKPVVKIIPIVQPSFKVGLLKGQVVGRGPDFFEPMDEGELASWEGAE
ncbi:prevent-host-death family protein [Rhizobium pisi]|jgi:prevent-host-death family protein|uniref:Antitoxin n=1 Tax=Rhizobium leguminosarum TaxID=384 RepID=A0AAE2MLE9_RHILE|nr:MULTISPECIES: type II toxin-antitoxin system prevent-host-death family antitoxin [Rhizobium]MBB4291300.1 prevent-host-death family protein [Rhizobium leguminosarum]MBB4297605.1 prevent-host-death family protein [Rhizobium leguminosarum]MBB4308745.1 prevent-host-death family protein [Rhizobium leguminosarum]MBB4416580.1 prevent-host-death family protein [Rhizobium leguminosarum]MBB4430452.1 prevent-host-death family protein [Rhizobium esperanzae]